ncbi:MAG: hypothetical protein SGPRY_000508 [Prymnesium sp.]
MAPKKSKPKAPTSGGKAEATQPTGQPVSSDPLDGAEEEPEEEEESSSSAQNKLREGADVSRVTDFVEQKELDSARASRALASIAADDTVDREAERERERELAAVKIDQASCCCTPQPSLIAQLRAAIVCISTNRELQADLDLIISEMEMDKETAERKLREHQGDVVQTLNSLVAA